MRLRAPEILLIVLLSKKLITLLNISKKELIKKIKLILSLNISLYLCQKLKINENNKKIIDNEIAEGKRNKPMKKENLPNLKQF